MNFKSNSAHTFFKIFSLNRSHKLIDDKRVLAVADSTGMISLYNLLQNNVLNVFLKLFFHNSTFDYFVLILKFLEI